MCKNIKVGSYLSNKTSNIDSNKPKIHARVLRRINKKLKDGYNEVKYIVRYTYGNEVEMTKHEIRDIFNVFPIKEQVSLKSKYSDKCVYKTVELSDKLIMTSCALVKEKTFNCDRNVKNFYISIGVSVCSPSDKFDDTYGKDLSFKRALKCPTFFFDMTTNGHEYINKLIDEIMSDGNLLYNRFISDYIY